MERKIFDVFVSNFLSQIFRLPEIFEKVYAMNFKMKLRQFNQLMVKLLKQIPILARQQYARFQALPVEQRKGIIKGGILFVSGILVGVLVTLGIMKASQGDASTPASASAAVNPNATDWTELVGNMCQTNSPLNLLAMKLDFPFQKCMNVNGQIDSACVQADAARFQPTLPQPYQQNLDAMTVKIGSAEDGSPVMNYYLPLKDASFQQIPLTALAVNIAMKSDMMPVGWQTPHLVIQGDYSTIKNALANYTAKPQTVYYAHIPANRDALPGPFNSLEEAKIETRRAGGKTSLIKKYRLNLDANFLEGVNEVVLSCVPQAVK